MLARRLYNDLIAQIRQVMGEVGLFVLDRAGPAAAAVVAELDGLNAAFAEARHSHRAEIQARFLGRRYEAIAIEPVRLQEAAQEMDPLTGARSEFGLRARAGRDGWSPPCRTWKRPSGGPRSRPPAP